MHFELFGVQYNTLAFVFGIGATIIAVISYFKTDKKRFLIPSACSYLCSFLECLFILLDGTNTWAAMFSSAISIIRNLILFYFVKKNVSGVLKYVGGVACILLWIVSIPFFKEWYSFVPPINFTLLTISMVKKDFLFTKIASTIFEAAYIVYNVAINSLAGIMRDGILFVFSILTLVIYISTVVKKKKIENIKE